MQRQIKFQVYCIEEKRMFQVEQIDFLNNEIRWVCNCGGIHWRNTKDFSLLRQFTGLTDKTGKDIYEDDYVWDDMDEQLSVIGYHQIDYGNDFRLCTLDPATMKPRDNFYGGVFGLDCLTVVGNIHENNLEDFA